MLRRPFKAKRHPSKKWKVCPNVEIRNTHKLWQVKHKSKIRQAKKECNIAKVNNKKFLKYIRNRKPAIELVGPLDDRSVKSAFREKKAIEEKLNKIFASVFSREDTGEIPMPEQYFLKS